MELKYHAFLSYSHQDAKCVRWLHRSLERYTIDKDLQGRLTSRGPVPRNLRPVFRDRDDFAAGLALANQTMMALNQSRALIVLCTPAAAQSKHVNEEIRVFKWKHPERPIIPVIADGEPGHPERECYPAALSFKVGSNGEVTFQAASEPVGADLRPGGDGRELGLAKVVSGLLDVPTDEIVRRAEKDRRRKLRWWVTGLSGVALSLAGLAGWAEINRQTAVKQRLLTEKAFERASQSSNELVGELVQKFRHEEGIPQTLIVSVLEKAEALVDGLALGGAANPDVERSLGVALVELSSELLSQREVDQAADAARKAVSIFERLLKGKSDDPGSQRDLLAALDRHGDALAQNVDLASALEVREQGLALARGLIKNDPSSISGRRLLAIALEKKADLMQDSTGSAGLALHQESLAIREQLTKLEPTSLIAKRELAVSLDRVAEALLTQGQREEALQMYEKSLTIATETAAANPRNTAFRREVAIAHQRLGDALKRSGKVSSALANYRRDLEIMKSLVDSDPTNRGWKLDILKSYFRVGDGSLAEGQSHSALQFYEEGLAIAQQITLDAPDAADWRAVSAFFERISKTLSQMGQDEAALMRAKEGSAFLRRAAAGREDQSIRLARSLNNEAWYGILAQRYKGALRAAEDAIALAPTTLEFRVNKIHALALSGSTGDAESFYAASRTLKGTDPAKLDGIVQRDLDDLRTHGFSPARLQVIASLLERFVGQASSGELPSQ